MYEINFTDWLVFAGLLIVLVSVPLFLIAARLRHIGGILARIEQLSVQSYRR